MNFYDKNSVVYCNLIEYFENRLLFDPDDGKEEQTCWSHTHTYTQNKALKFCSRCFIFFL